MEHQLEFMQSIEKAVKYCDVFPVDPNPSVKGKESVSEPLSLLFGPVVIAVTIWISFSSIAFLWAPLADLAITSGVGSTTNMTFTPFIIAPVHHQAEDKEKIRIVYKSTLEDVNVIDCPSNLLEKHDPDLIQCYLTNPIKLESNEEILFVSSDKDVKPNKILVEKFSLDTKLENKQPYLFQNIFLSLFFNFVKVTPVKLTICDSLISEMHSEQYLGIRSFSSVYDAIDINLGLFGSISFQQEQTCLQYKINRDSFLSILAAVTSWFQSICGVVAVLVIFNALSLKRLIGSEIYSSKQYFKRKIMFVKLYFFNILDIIGLGTFLHNRFQWFKKEALISEETDKMLSLDYIFRILNFRNEMENNNINQSSEVTVQEIKSQDSQQFDNAEEQKNYRNKSKIRQSNHLILRNHHSNFKERFSSKTNMQLPEQSDGVISSIFQKFNMNAINVSLSSEDTEKSSKLSVAITVVGIVLVLVLLWYLGAFAPKELRDSKYIIKPTNTIHMEKQNTMIYAFLADHRGDQVFMSEDIQMIYFVKMDKNYQIVQKYKTKQNCSAENQYGIEIIYNYCLDSIISLETNQAQTQRLGIIGSKLYDLQLHMFYRTAVITYDDIYITIKKNIISLFSEISYEGQIQRTHFKSRDNTDYSQSHAITFSQQSVKGICTSPFCMIFTLIRQQYMLTILEDSNYYMFQNVWSITYLLFSFLIIFLILPYNSKVSKENLSGKIGIREQEAISQNNHYRNQHKVYQVSNIIMTLKTLSMEKELFYVKTTL